MKLATILAVLARLLNWFLDRQQGRAAAEQESEVRNAVGRDAKIVDMERAADIDRRTDAVLDRVRRADGDTAPGDRDQYRD